MRAGELRDSLCKEDQIICDEWLESRMWSNRSLSDSHGNQLRAMVLSHLNESGIVGQTCRFIRENLWDLALLYIFANLCLFKTNLSRSFIELHTDFFCLVLSVWYIAFCQKELGSYFIEETEIALQEFQVSEPGKSMVAFPQPLTDFCKQYTLTEWEAQILQLILSGKSNQEIAETLYITVGTVKAHIHSIFGKLDITRRSQLITMLLDYKPGK